MTDDAPQATAQEARADGEPEVRIRREPDSPTTLRLCELLRHHE